MFCPISIYLGDFFHILSWVFFDQCYFFISLSYPIATPRSSATKWPPICDKTMDFESTSRSGAATQRLVKTSLDSARLMFNTNMYNVGYKYKAGDRGVGENLGNSFQWPRHSSCTGGSRFLQRRRPRERRPRCVLAFGVKRGKLSLDLGFTRENR